MFMKKVFAILMTVVMLGSIFTVPVFAYQGNQSFGQVPVSGEAISIDGVKDAIYEQGLKIEINRLAEEVNEGDGSTNATAWLLWRDSALYVFVETRDSDVVMEAGSPNAAEWPWLTDSVELWLDPGNWGEMVWQFRVSAFGAVQSHENVPFQGVANAVPGGYNIEFRVPIENEAGSSLGISFQINEITSGWGTEMTEHTEIRSLIFDEGSWTAMPSWAPMNWDYITLSANEVNVPVIAVIAEPEPEDTPAAAEIPAAVETPVVSRPAAAPRTGDTGIIIALAVAIMAVCVAVVRKHKKELG